MSLLSVCTPCRRSLTYQALNLSIRRSASTLETTASSSDTAQPPPSSSSSSPPENLNPARVYTPAQEKQLHQKYGLRPIGSRRRRAALVHSQEIPFEQLPYQCFQEALNYLRQDRQQKVHDIGVQRARIQRLKDQQPESDHAATHKMHRMSSMLKRLEYLKIQADINDPLVKRRFEDGKGDLNRPIYRFLAGRKWRSRRKLITEQRITQMHVVPDVIPTIALTADVELLYHGKNDRDGKTILPKAVNRNPPVRVMPGQFIASIITKDAPRLKIQVFDRGMRNVTIAAIDPDMPNLEADSFDTRCIYLASNIPISHLPTTVDLSAQSNAQTVLPWTPPYAHKGAPYHRIAFLVFQQPEDGVVDVQSAAATLQREGFSMRDYAARHGLRPIGAHLFRTQWDEWMQKVMRQAGIPGAEIEFKFKRVDPLLPKKRDSSRFR